MDVTLVGSYNLAWAEWFERLRGRIEAVLGEVAHTVEHVGSTAVPGMVAKGVIDNDQQAYIDGKAAMVREITELVKEEFRAGG